MAKRLGARVIGTVSTPEKAALAKAAGADRTVLYTTEDFVAAAKEFTAGRGVNVIYDSVGKTTFEKGFDALALRGMMALFGQASGPVGPLDPQLLNQKGSIFLTRPTLFHYIATREELLERAGAVLGWVKEGSLKLHIGLELPLAKAADAHRALEGRQTTGKVLLIP
jgi:NADPH2:quinone reductase